MWSPTVSSDELWHHGIKDQRWGVRNGPPYPLSKASTKLALQICKKAYLKEPKITTDVVSAVNSTGGQMYGLEHKLKTKDSVKRKIETNSEEKNITYKEAAADIKDAVRYTAISSDKDFVKNYNNIKKSLETKGYKEERCKNYFDLYDKGKVKHKSVQSVFSDKDGYQFEIQFHTPSSQQAKNKKIPIYEERRKPGNSDKRNAELEKQMVDLAEKVTRPNGIETIKSH